MRPCAASFVAAALVFVSMDQGAAHQTIEDCAPTDLIELRMVKPKLQACEESRPHDVSLDSSRAEKEAVCAASATCGQLLPYLAHMKKYPCQERMAFSGLGDKLLVLCDEFPYKSVDPKWILVGKPLSTDSQQTISSVETTSAAAVDAQRHRRPEPPQEAVAKESD